MPLLSLLLSPALAATTGPAHLTQSLIGGAALDRFGHAVAAADFDGDGIDDLAVALSRPGWDTPSEVQVYLGTTTGLSSTSAATLPAGAVIDALAAGDFDGDGLADLAVGFHDETTGQVHLHRGRATGLDATPVVVDPAVPQRGFGEALCVADTDGDGLDELIIGQRDTYADVAGAWILDGHPALAGALTAIEDIAPIGIRPLGDVDGDGFDDLAYPLASEGEWWLNAWAVAFGSPTGPALSAARAFTSQNDALWAVGDIDGDGDHEVASADTYEYFSCCSDEVTIYEGGPHVRPAPGGPTDTLVSVPMVLLESTMDDDDFGEGVGPVGDWNGDGFADPLVGTRYLQTRFAFLGGPSGVVVPEVSTVTPDLSSPWEQATPAAGDFDGDGAHELAIGDAAFAGSVGRVLVYAMASGPVTTPPTVDTGTPQPDTGTVAPTGTPAKPNTGDPTNEGGCSCGSMRPSAGWGLPMLLLLGLSRRERDQRATHAP